MNNIGQWLQVDAFILLKNSFGGSGYDIACAQNDCPIVYHLEQGNPIIEKVPFSPKFTTNIHFVYLNKKQNSKTAITKYKRNGQNNLSQIITLNDQTTSEVLAAKTVQAFTEALEKHEKDMSSILEAPTIKDSLFPDFSGTIKSLGAWGGDFVMVISNENPTEYFTQKGYTTVIPYDEIILT